MPYGQNDPVIGRAPAQPGYGAGDPVLARAKPNAKPTKTSEALGFYKGLTRPLDNAAIWLENAADQVGLADPINDLASRVGLVSAHESDRQHRAYIDQQRDKGVKPGLVGEVAGNIVGTAPALLATKNPLAVGGIQGALTTDKPDDAGQVWNDANWGVAGAYVGGKVGDKIADVARPWVSPAVATMKKYGVKVTPGQMGSDAKRAAEDKMMSLPIVGPMIAADRETFKDTLNRGAINRALFPLGVKLPDNIATGQEAVAWMQKQAGDAYNKILPGLTLKADPRIAVGIRNAWDIAQSLKPEDQQRFLSLIQSKARFAPDGTLSGRALPVALRDIRDLAAKFSKGDADQQILGEALSAVHEGYMDALASQNPAAAKALKAANEAYRNSLVVNRAAAAAAGNEGVATAGQLTTASRMVDRSKNKAATAAGRGPMQDFTKAASAVTGKTPDSGTAGRLLSGSAIGNLRGALAAAGYQADKALGNIATAANASPVGETVRATASKVASSPQVAPALARLRGLLADYGDPAALLAAQPTMRGLLAGILGDE